MPATLGPSPNPTSCVKDQSPDAECLLRASARPLLHGLVTPQHPHDAQAVNSPSEHRAVVLADTVDDGAAAVHQFVDRRPAMHIDVTVCEGEEVLVQQAEGLHDHADQVDVESCLLR